MINMKDLIKQQGNMIRKQSGMKIDETTNVSSNPFRAWSENSDNIRKLDRDCQWALKAIPHKKKEINKIRKSIKDVYNLIEIIKGQAIDL